MGKRAFREKAVCQGIFSSAIDKVRGERGVSQGKHNSDAEIIKPLSVTLQDFGPLPSISCLSFIYS